MRVLWDSGVSAGFGLCKTTNAVLREAWGPISFATKTSMDNVTWTETREATWEVTLATLQVVTAFATYDGLKRDIDT